MTASLRALLAALVIVLAAAVGATYIGLHHGFEQSAWGGGDTAIQVASNGEVSDFVNPQDDGAQLVDLALRQVDRVYYKPVDPQTLVSGERKGLLEYLKSRHVKDASVPASQAVPDVGQDALKAVQTLNYAQAHYARGLGIGANTALTEAALRGMLSSLGDPYTVYLSPKEIRGLNETLSGGNFGGIGVYIYQLRDKRVLLQPIDGLPAANAGMKPFEILLQVNGKSIAGMSLDRVEQIIRGTAGTVVHLQSYAVDKPKAKHSYAIVRAIVHVPTVHAKMEGGYEYIRLTEFGDTSAAEVEKALLNGRAHHAKGYILDLRNNGGGLLQAAVKISSLFIPQGVIVSTINRAGARDEQEALGTAIGGLRPLVVLVNKYTASASEITSGAIQDYHVGTLIGTKTFGKGIVQSIYPMPDSGALKITTARYLTPLGRDIQHKGIIPDIVINQDPAIIDTPADKQLAVAKARLAELSR